MWPHVPCTGTYNYALREMCQECSETDHYKGEGMYWDRQLQRKRNVLRQTITKEKECTGTDIPQGRNGQGQTFQRVGMYRDRHYIGKECNGTDPYRIKIDKQL